MNRTIYYNQNTQQISLNQKDWIDIKNYNEYDVPYWDLNEQKDWCSISLTLKKDWLRCFVKEQANLFDDSRYYQGWVKVDEILNNNFIIFDCSEVVKDNLTGKWVKKH